MDVRMPNGLVIKGVPDGMTRQQLTEKLSANGYDMKSLMTAPQPSLSEDIATAVSNVPSSAANLAGDIVGAVMSPVQTGKSMLDLMAGTLRAGAQKVLPESVFSGLESLGDKGAAERAGRVASAVGSHLKKRYGEDLRKTLTTDPVGVASDVAGLLSGGAGLVAKGAGAAAALGGKSAQLAKLAEASRKTSSAIAAVDPANVMLKVPVKAAGAVAAGSLGLSTGAGGQAIREAYRAGAAPSATPSREFLSNISGKRDPMTVVEQAQKALETKRAADFQNYLANTNRMRGDTTVLSAADVARSINSAKEVFRDTKTGYVFDDVARDAWREVARKYRDWASNPRVTGVSSDFDVLKRSIGSLDKLYPEGRPKQVWSQVSNAIRETISKQNPEYHAAMKKSEDAISELNSIRRELSLGDKKKTTAALKKLQSVLRNNVNTSWGGRLKMADELQKYTPKGADLRASLAGQALSSLEPRGLARLSGIPIGAGLGASYLGANPVLAAISGLVGLAASSPKMVGYGAYGAGLLSPAGSAVRESRLPLLQAAREEERKELEAQRRAVFGPGQ